MISRCKLLILLAVVLTVALFGNTGCSNSNSNDNIVSYGKIKVHYNNLPADIDTLYFSIYTPSGTCVWGPKAVDVNQFPDVASLYMVPIRCNSLAVAGYDEDAKSALYFASTEVTVEAGETLDVEDLDIKPVSEASFLDYHVAQDQRAHIGDTISFQVMAATGTIEKHYWQDLTQFATWTVGTDSRLATTSSSDAPLDKGTYRCLSTVDDDVEVTATLGSNSDTASVAITDATIKSAEFYTSIGEVPETSEKIYNKISSIVEVPMAAEYRPIFFVASWSDGEKSLLNTSASWENDDPIGYIAPNKGFITGIGNKPEADVQVDTVKIVANYTSNKQRFSDSCLVTVVSKEFTGISLPDDTLKMVVGDDVDLEVMGQYGTDIAFEIPDFLYELSNSDEAVVTVVDGSIEAKAAGTSTITVKSKVNKSFSDKCEVEVVDAEPEV